MRSVWAVVCLLVLGSALVGNAQGPAGPASATGRTALTIYNQDFAVIRTPVELNLQAGTTEVSETNVTAQVEPDSVVLTGYDGQASYSHPRAELRRRVTGAVADAGEVRGKDDRLLDPDERRQCEAGAGPDHSRGLCAAVRPFWNAMASNITTRCSRVNSSRSR